MLAAACAGLLAGTQQNRAGSRAHRPAAAPELPPVQRIAAGGYAGYALLADGHVWAWGDDLEGQIGRAGAWRFRSSPVEVRGIADAVAIAGGGNTAYAVDRGGAVWAWGDDSVHELGDSRESARQRPVRVPTPAGIVAVAGGMLSAYALRRDGTVWAWGENAVGQLGTTGSQDARGTPRPVERLTGVVAIAAGASDGYALTADGTVWAWGDNSLGQLGAAACTAAQAAAARTRCPAAGVPVRIRGLTGVAAIAAGADTGYALRRDGTVWAWGDGTFGALGGGGRRRSVDPVRVAGLEHVDAIGAGSASAYAVLHDGSVWAWGRGVDGELGNGVFSASAVPRRVLAPAAARQVEAGGAMAYMLDRDGRVWAWGGGLYGQLGNGHRLNLAVPTEVLKLGPRSPTI
jgi:alpha-tubulin suppressor-like RCC1 family protein